MRIFPNNYIMALIERGGLMKDIFFNQNADEPLDDADDQLLSKLRMGVTVRSIPSQSEYWDALRIIAKRSYRVDTVARAIKSSLLRYSHYHHEMSLESCSIQVWNPDSGIRAYITDYHEMPYQIFPYLPNAIVTGIDTNCHYRLIENTFSYYAQLTIKLPEVEFVNA